MRASFISGLIELAREDENIYLLVADVGYRLVEPYAEEFPDRFVNIGIAEQNMIGIATGLALSGKTVFAYSIANFPIFRCLEQIRNDVCYHRADVKIVTAGGGLVYGALGSTHHVTEDLALMRALPNMTVVAPADPVEAALAVRAIAGQQGPCYLRLGRTGEPNIHKITPGDFQIGKALKVRDGGDIALIASGGIVYNAMQAAQQLAGQGIESRVLSMHTIKPLDKEAVLSAGETGAIVTIEEHSIIGGLGSAVAEVLSEGSNSNVAFMRVGIPDEFCAQVGSHEYLREIYSLSVGGIVASVKKFMETKASRV